MKKQPNGVAAVLSFFIPGLGQVYKGQVISGVVWLMLVPIGYLLFIIPGLVLHFLCVWGASRPS
jgi:TM2 domain-containing membrane protein YozV